MGEVDALFSALTQEALYLVASIGEGSGKGRSRRWGAGRRLSVGEAEATPLAEFLDPRIRASAFGTCYVLGERAPTFAAEAGVVRVLMLTGWTAHRSPLSQAQSNTMVQDGASIVNAQEEDNKRLFRSGCCHGCCQCPWKERSASTLRAGSVSKSGAGGGDRTHKAGEGRRILSPLRLPISPPRHVSNFGQNGSFRRHLTASLTATGFNNRRRLLR